MIFKKTKLHFLKKCLPLFNYYFNIFIINLLTGKTESNIHDNNHFLSKEIRVILPIIKFFNYEK